MKCYGQIIYECGSMASPFPDDYQVWDSIAAAKRALERAGDDPIIDTDQGVSLLLWLGTPDPEVPYPCDGANFYPDRHYELGPRGGVRPAH